MPSPIIPPTSCDPSPPPTLTLADLKPESDLLHLLFHRNKNQHHSSKWWKWLGMLRRNLRKLLDPADAAGVESRLEYMRLVVVPSCYIAFTSVVANNQFAPLGLALLASLARVHRIVGTENRVKVEEREKVMGAAAVVQDVREACTSKRKGLVVGPVTKEDFGEAMQRERAMWGKETLGGEGEGEGEGEEVVLEKNTVVVEKERGDQQTITVEAKPRKENSKEIQSTRRKGTQARRKGEAMRPTTPSLLSPRLISPQTREETPKRKVKRKADDKRGAKKKKRKKVDEIDDLFAGLL